jgi:serine/threonine-protein kinase
MVPEKQSAAQSAAAWDIPGYQMLEQIGEGGTGQVYRARPNDSARLVAIKVLSPAPTGRPAPPDREWQLMSSLSHPNIVALHDRGQVNGRPYLVMEHVAGAPLRAAMTPGQPWPLARAAPVLDTVARALAYIHGQGILHLDLKPENVLCAADGRIKVTDFGLALPRVDARTLVERGLVQGTLDYCSPEQRYGLPLDQRSDIFSLATVAYELLTGRLPGRVYRSACAANPSLPAALDTVLGCGLARDAHDRQGSVEEFRQEFAMATEGREE